MSIIIWILKAIAITILAGIGISILAMVLFCMAILTEEIIRIIKQRKGGKK